jgi:hypothetical protein
VRDRCELEVSFGAGYLDVRPLGLHDWTLDHYMVILAVVLSLLSLVFEGQVKVSGYGVYGSEGWETSGLLRRILAFLRTWRLVVWLCLRLGYLRACSEIHYL